MVLKLTHQARPQVVVSRILTDGVVHNIKKQDLRAERVGKDVEAVRAVVAAAEGGEDVHGPGLLAALVGGAGREGAGRTRRLACGVLRIAVHLRLG